VPTVQLRRWRLRSCLTSAWLLLGGVIEAAMGAMTLRATTVPEAKG
jgi:hypothetical protein